MCEWQWESVCVCAGGGGGGEYCFAIVYTSVVHEFSAEAASYFSREQASFLCSQSSELPTHIIIVHTSVVCSPTWVKLTLHTCNPIILDKLTVHLVYVSVWWICPLVQSHIIYHSFQTYPKSCNHCWRTAYSA